MNEYVHIPRFPIPGHLWNIWVQNEHSTPGVNLSDKEIFIYNLKNQIRVL